MAPRLPSGALVVARAIDGRMRLRVGDVVVARRPDRPELEIIKRITAIDAGGAIFLGGDNPASSTDSRQFGPVTRGHILVRVRWRYWPPPPARLSSGAATTRATRSKRLRTVSLPSRLIDSISGGVTVRPVIVTRNNMKKSREDQPRPSASARSAASIDSGAQSVSARSVAPALRRAAAVAATSRPLGISCSGRALAGSSKEQRTIAGAS